MKLVFAPAAWEDYLHWQDTDRTMLKRINALIMETTHTPFTGTGKPEGLKHALARLLVTPHQRRTPTGLQGRG